MNISLDESKMNEITTQLTMLTKNLLDTLENDDRGKTLVAQQAFTGTISAMWNATEENEMDPKLKAILRLIAGWAINELPKEIDDPVNDGKIKRELTLFQRSLTMFN
jgi:hypothetical protein